jgi:hypothetical protein
MAVFGDKPHAKTPTAQKAGTRFVERHHAGSLMLEIDEQTGGLLSIVGTI